MRQPAHALSWYTAAIKTEIALEHISPRRLVAAVKLDLLECRKGAVDALREAGWFYRFVRAHAPDGQACERSLLGHDQGRVSRLGEDRDVHRETELAETRAARGEDGQAGGRGAGLRREIGGQVKGVDGARPQGELLDFGPPVGDGRQVRVAEVRRDGRVEREAAQVGETGERGEGREGDVELGRRGVVERLTEAGQGLEGKVGQGRMGLLREDGERGRPGIDGAEFQVGFEVHRVQSAALWGEVGEKNLSCGRGCADSEGSKGGEEGGIGAGRSETLG